MRQMIHIMQLALMVVVLSVCPALGDMKVVVKVSGGGTYDYAMLGHLKGATDGFDNAFDTISPTNNMNNEYISVVILHPEWSGVKDSYRGDFRFPKVSDVWDLTIETNLPSGTQIEVSLDDDNSTIPKGFDLLLEDPDTGAVSNIKDGYIYEVDAYSGIKHLQVTAQRDESLGFILSGVVLDSAGLPIDGAELILRGSKGINESTLTGADGSYTFEGLEAGMYRMRVQSSSGLRFKNVTVEISDNDVVIDFTPF